MNLMSAGEMKSMESSEFDRFAPLSGQGGARRDIFSAKANSPPQTANYNFRNTT